MMLLPASALASASMSGSSTGVGQIPVFVVAGQSNAQGVAGTAAVPGVRYTFYRNYFFPQLHGWNGTAWQKLDDSIRPWSSNSYNATQWPWFAKKWMEQVGRPVRLIYVYLGGTCLCTDDEGEAGEPVWDPDKTLGPATGAWYDLLVTTVKQTVKPGVALRAILWSQGGSDRNGDTIYHLDDTHRVEDCQLALENLAEHIHEDIGVDMIIAASSTGENEDPECEGTHESGYADINTAQHAAALASPYIRDTVVDMDDLEFKADNCHHVYNVDVLGERWFDAVQAEGLAY